MVGEYEKGGDLNLKPSRVCDKELKKMDKNKKLGEGNTKMSHLQICSVKIFKERCKFCTKLGLGVQRCHTYNLQTLKIYLKRARGGGGGGSGWRGQDGCE